MAFKRQFGHPIPTQTLARKIADQAQLRTQQASKRPLGCTALLMSLDPELGPQLLKIDPTGQFLKCKAMCIGKGEEASLKHLEETVESIESRTAQFHPSVNESIQIVIECLVKASTEDEDDSEVTADNIEVAIISNINGSASCRMLGKDEIENFLTLSAN
mmetsp:Transcript_27917/g.36310  ORF Transcript_27917/g.36310 Transcript_27917/m.36310 type:complete len:160 (-) Transcript_27917:139-618(-)